jgi:hypothetical protein
MRIFGALGGIPAIIRGKGDSPIFVNTKIGTVPLTLPSSEVFWLFGGEIGELFVRLLFEIFEEGVF